MGQPRSGTGKILRVHPHCLMVFTDETGDEKFADPNSQIFGMGGIAVLAAAIDPVVRKPWRTMKDRHFSGAEVRLHAADLRSPRIDQITALNEFFEKQDFGRFAVTMTRGTDLPDGITPIQAMVGLLRRRWQELAARFHPVPVEVAFIHEAGRDQLLERYFGRSVVAIDRKEVPVHHGIMAKGDEALEVADFVVHTAGGQARHPIQPSHPVRRDFQAIFRSNPLRSSFFALGDGQKATGSVGTSRRNGETKTQQG